MRKEVVLSALVLLCTTAAAEAANDTLETAYQAVLGEKRSQVLPDGGVGYYA